MAGIGSACVINSAAKLMSSYLRLS